MKRLTVNQIRLIKIFFLFIFFALAGSSNAFDLEKKAIKTKLANGITVLMLERHISPTVSLYIRYRVGAVDESDGETGAAHFLEHMMFKGTKTIGTKNYAAEKKILAALEKTGNALDTEKQKGRKADQKLIADYSQRLKKLRERHRQFFVPNEIDRLYTESGGLDMNASTGQDVTTYHISLPSNKIELWARIESDRLTNPVFREFYTERDVILEERRQRVDTSPHGRLYEQFLNTAYQIHPYRRPIIGWAQDIMNLSPDSLRKIFQKYKTPENIVIAVVGNINPPDTLILIEKYFGRIPAVRRKQASIPVEPKQTAERRTTVIFDASPKLMIGFHKPTIPAHDNYALDVLETILTKGRTSRLFNLLVSEKGIAKSVSASNGIPGARYPNLFVISAEPRFPHTTEELEEVILSEIEKIKITPIPQEEMTKAKNHLRMEYINSLDSNSKIASILSYYELLLGDYRYFADYLKYIDRVSESDIQIAVENYFHKNNRTVAVLSKKKD